MMVDVVWRFINDNFPISIKKNNNVVWRFINDNFPIPIKKKLVISFFFTLETRTLRKTIRKQ